MTAQPQEHPELPRAKLLPSRSSSWFWFLPLLALLLVGWIGYRAWSMRGVTITVQLDRGHGLASGAELRYKDITVGRVEKIEVDEDLEGIIVTAVLQATASRLARSGSKFWIVRPQVGVTGVAGLETVVGPRYLAMLPGDGPARRQFMGLSEPPVVEYIEPGDLEIFLETTRRSGLRPAAPVLYRQVQVGTILSVGLTTDGRAVEARVYIQKAYTQLIRERTRFWDVGGFEAKLGIRGMSIQMESFESLITGGVALATPPNGGDVVRTGHRFELASKPEDEWLEWQPLVVIGSPLLPPGATMPSPIRAVLTQKRSWIKPNRTRRGWVLQTSRGLLGPVDLLTTTEDDTKETILEVAGRHLELTTDVMWQSNDLALREIRVSHLTWPDQLKRTPDQTEDCLAVADAAGAPLPLARTRLSPTEGSWLIDSVLSIDESWHGAVVLARNDGYLIGMVIVEDDAARVALLPKEATGAQANSAIGSRGH